MAEEPKPQTEWDKIEWQTGELTAEHRRWLEVGKKRLEQTLPLVNDVCVKLIVLTTAWTGTLLAIKEIPISECSRIGSVVFTLISLSSAFFGIYPFSGNVNLDSPNDIRDNERKALEWKSKCLRVGAVALVLGFSTTVLGLLTTPAKPTPPTVVVIENKTP